ncbi:MAG: hypothetical protein QXL15_00540 [Candidatus Korarchaeota archaeon]
MEFIDIGSDELRGGMVDKALVEKAVEDVEVIYHLAINWDGTTGLARTLSQICSMLISEALLIF